MRLGIPVGTMKSRMYYAVRACEGSQSPRLLSHLTAKWALPCHSTLAPNGRASWPSGKRRPDRAHILGQRHWGSGTCRSPSIW